MSPWMSVRMSPTLAHAGTTLDRRFRPVTNVDPWGSYLPTCLAQDIPGKAVYSRLADLSVDVAGLVQVWALGPS
jgi:ribosome-associated toxin RatA of RatAB toxin-antitoxin module